MLCFGVHYWFLPDIPLYLWLSSRNPIRIFYLDASSHCLYHFRSIPWPSIWFMLSLNSMQVNQWSLMTFGFDSVFIIEMTPLMYFVLVSCDFVYIFFTWNLSWKVGFMHLFTMSSNKLANWSLFFLGRSWNAREINRWKSISSLDNVLFLMDLVSCFIFIKSLSKMALATFMPSIAFRINLSAPPQTPCLKLFLKSDALLAWDKLRSYCTFCFFLHFHHSHSLSCWINFGH